MKGVEGYVTKVEMLYYNSSRSFRLEIRFLSISSRSMLCLFVAFFVHECNFGKDGGRKGREGRKRRGTDTILFQ